MSMLEVGTAFELEGDKFKVIKFCGEGNQGLCVVEVKRPHGITYQFTVPDKLVDAAWGYAMMQVGR